MTQAEVENALGRNADDVLDTRDDRHCYWYLDDGEIAITLENNRLVHKRWEPSTLTWLERLMNKLAWN
jgi:hypothetical protein